MDHSSSKRGQQWQQILELTHQMRELSIEEELEQLAALQRQRQNEIEAFFASPIAEHESRQVAEGIQEILDSDRLLYQQGEHVKADIGDSLHKAMGNRKALNTYHGVSRN